MSGPVAPAAERNRQPILDVLRTELGNSRSVLEIGSGTGQHAVFFAAALRWLQWQTSDLPQNHAGINAWIDAGATANVARPFELDVLRPGDLEQRYDAVFSANTAHIMSIGAVEAMFGIVGKALHDHGLFVVYGPFRQGGAFSSESNRQFDDSLRNQDSSMGIRDLEELDAMASSAGLSRRRLYAMPANNNIVVWQKSPAAADGVTNHEA